ncbi:DNA polymerase III subunit gamma/tau [bacterium]|jgi:DNA polymerase III subunit gamma/tau|nr:DNA polymerase III subunit gamma/tau [bacterium]
MNLYQKYRPSSFKGLVSQEHVKQTLQNALKKNMLTHAYLFCGPRGTGKTSTARLLAKAINCENLDPKSFEPCNKCDICTQINNGSLVDLVEIDAASNRGVDEIRDLRESVKFAPSQSKNKVYIIDEVHMLTKEAFNALLKTLEEPPENVYFILATTELHKIPDTIVSRCQRFGFRRINFEDISNHLAYICKEEKVKVDTKALDKISLRSEGCMRDALSLLDQLISYGDVNLDNLNQILGSSQNDSVNDFVDNLINSRIGENLEIINQVHKDGLNLDEFCKSFIDCLQSKMIENIKNQIVCQKIVEISKHWMQIYNEFRQSNNLKFALEIICIDNNKISLESKSDSNSVGNTGSGIDEGRVLEIVNSKLKNIKLDNNQPKKTKTQESINLEDIKFELLSYIDKEISKNSKLIIPTSMELEPNDDMSSNLKKAIEVSNSLQPEEEENILSFEPDCNFKISELKRSWKKIVKKAPIPKLTRLLNEAAIEKVAENLYLVYSANFFLEQIQNPEYIRVVEKLLYEHNYAVRIKTISKKDWVSKTLSSSSSRPSAKSNSSAVASKDTKTVSQVKEIKTIEPVIESTNKSAPKSPNASGNIPLPEPTVGLNEEEDFNLEELFNAE